MAKFDDYTQKNTPEDTDISLILDKTANVNKKTPFSGIWTWIVNKMINAVIQNLQTTNKTVIGSINELNSNIIFRYFTWSLNTNITLSKGSHLVTIFTFGGGSGENSGIITILKSGESVSGKYKYGSHVTINIEGSNITLTSSQTFAACIIEFKI